MINVISDPPRGCNDALSQIDIAFGQIHVPTEYDCTQDLTLMKELIWCADTRRC